MGGSSMSWTRTSSQSIMPGTGSRVVNGYGATSGVALVNLRRRLLRPAFGPPRNTTVPAPWRGILKMACAFFGPALTASTSSETSLIFVLRIAWTFSLALCLGRMTHIFLRAASFSSGVRALLYSASASWYWGGRLTAMGSFSGQGSAIGTEAVAAPGPDDTDCVAAVPTTAIGLADRCPLTA